MGCCCGAPPEVRIRALEEQIYARSGIPKESYSQRFVTINMSDGTSHDIWTTVVNHKSEAEPDDEIDMSNPDGIHVEVEKETLVMTHGFGGATAHFVTTLPELMKHYRIVMFDNLSFGSNPRNGNCLVDRSSVLAVEAWLVEYWERWVDKVDLPKRFLLAAHSFGGYQAALYASKHPERIIKFMGISPANFEPFDQTKTYDPYSFRTDDSNRPPPRWQTNMSMRCIRSEDRSMCSLLDIVPERMVRRKFG